jgi:Ca2+-binding RTX toxin-like protein
MGNSANGGNVNKRGIWWLTNMESGQQSPDPIQDELSIISNSTNGFGYRADDHTYSSFVTLSPDPADPDGPIGPGTGVIETTADADPFKFTAHAYAGTFTISATLTAAGGAMLSPSGRLIDAATLAPIASNVSINGTSATVSTTAMVPGHDYFIEVDSAGNYGDIGQYTVSGTFTDPDVVATGGQTISSVEGDSTGSVLLATFTDPGGPEALSNYSADINWGDGSGLHVGAGSISLNGSTFEVRGTYTYAEESAADHGGSNPYQITVTIHHRTSTPQSVTSTATVSEAALVGAGQDITPVEGIDTGSVLIATFTDKGGPEAVADYSADIDWGDGTGLKVGAGTITLNGTTFEVRGNHTYAEESAADHPNSTPYQITVTVHHETAADAIINSTATVSDPAVSATGGFTFNAVEGGPSATQTVATFTDPGGAEAIADYSASIDWGDGTLPSSGTILFAAGVFTVQGSHTYAVGLGLPDDFGNTFCDGTPPKYHKAITVSVSHEAAPMSQATSDATISIAPGTAHLAGGNLIVVGTTADDQIVISPVANSGSVKVTLNSASLGSFTLGSGGRIIVAALAGNDDVEVAGGVLLPSVLYGGPGDDRLKGGGGKNILVGCDGNDLLIAGKQGDLLIGGNGSDRLIGGAGNDILVAANIVNPVTLAEDTTFSHLIAALNGGPIVADDDGAVDVLTGAAGTDEFFYHYLGNLHLDIVTDKAEIAFNT